MKLLRKAGLVSGPLPLFLAADFLVIAGTLWIAQLVRFSLDFEAMQIGVGPILPRAAIIGALVILGMASMGLYGHRQRPRPWEVASRVLIGVLIGALASVLLFYVFPVFQTGRGVMGLAVLLAVIGLTLERWWLLRIVDTAQSKRRVLVLGAGRAASRIANLRRRADRRRFDIVGYVPVGDADLRLAEELGLAPVLDFREALARVAFDEIVVAQDDRRGNFPTHDLLEQRFRGVLVTEIVEFLERETEKIHFDVMQPGWLVFSPSDHAHPLFLAAKRLFDIGVSVSLLLVTSPILLLVMLAIKIEDGLKAPVFYRQERVGQDDRLFKLLKFRSMGADAEASGARWSGSDDERVTVVGRFLRRFRLDEVPQLVNVIRGDMSIVGPRPERPEFVEELIDKVPYYNYRHSVRPGLTGWAQLNFPYGSSVTDAKNKLAYDLYYIKNTSIALDLFIFLQTIEVVLWGRAISMAGPLRSEEVPAEERPPAPENVRRIGPADRDVA